MAWLEHLLSASLPDEVDNASGNLPYRLLKVAAGRFKGGTCGVPEKARFRLYGIYSEWFEIAAGSLGGTAEHRSYCGWDLFGPGPFYAAGKEVRSVILRVIPLITNAGWISSQLKGMGFGAVALDCNKPRKTEARILSSLKWAGTRSSNVQFPGEYGFLVQ
ncbi:hypothetical protein OOU_Y34scaffold00455g1 [Pyricularia oryzae Y34]|uniref:Uncharacterized protein n=2 Tax=Pyricularia oryzae TaxID=318829 RepID=A0AA97P1I1_PYRO3|nr:hypothetical protein OOU_Y34scaffold00455g1 [Pyricularia oryzae Y34]